MGIKHFCFRILLCVLFLFSHIFFNKHIYASTTGSNKYKLNLIVDASLLLGAASTQGFAYFLGDKLHDKITEEEVRSLKKDDINSIDRWAVDKNSRLAVKASDITLYISSIAPSLLTIEPIYNRQPGPLLILTIMYIEVYSLSKGLASSAKVISNRLRPYMYSSNVSRNEKLSTVENRHASKSFYSSHTSTAFSSMVFLATVYSDIYSNSALKPLVWAGSLLIASATAYFRVSGGMHYPSDVLAGAVMGSLVGYGIPYLHRGNIDPVTVYPELSSCEGNEYAGFGIRFRY